MEIRDFRGARVSYFEFSDNTEVRDTRKGKNGYMGLSRKAESRILSFYATDSDLQVSPKPEMQIQGDC